jgi:hypothetical protein
LLPGFFGLRVAGNGEYRGCGEKQEKQITHRPPFAGDILQDCGHWRKYFGARCRVLFQFAEPDVAVADWVSVVLQCERKFFWAGGVSRAHPESNP